MMNTTTTNAIEKMLQTNVNEHTEKKNNLTYLSWAWAWAEALKADPAATYKVEMFGDKCYMDINGTAMVWVTVTLFGKPMTCQLPVMDSSNKAIPLSGYTAVSKYGKEYRVEFDAFAVNTAIMRCMTKALSLHGLGLYIYAGEDLPEEALKEKKNWTIPETDNMTVLKNTTEILVKKAKSESELTDIYSQNVSVYDALKKSDPDLHKEIINLFKEAKANV